MLLSVLILFGLLRRETKPARHKYQSAFPGLCFFCAAFVCALIANGGQATAAESPGCSAFSGSYNQGGAGGNTTNSYSQVFYAGDQLNVNVISIGPEGSYSLYGGAAGTLASGATTGGTYTVPATGPGITLQIAVFSVSGTDISWSCTPTSSPPTPSATTTSVSSSLNPSNFGRSVAFTAAVGGEIDIPTGTVTFVDQSTSTTLGTSSFSLGMATVTISTLSVGSHTIQATYSGDSINLSSSSTVAQTVNPANLTVTSTPAATTQVGQAYSQTNVASNGAAPYTYAISAGALPAGTSLNSATGTVSGTPTNAGSFSYTVKATDSTTPTALTGTQTLNGTIALGVDTIIFPQPPDTAFTSAPPTLTATATSGIAVSYASNTTGICTVTSSGAITFVSIGSCSITASQSATTNYAAATSITKRFNITAGANTITFPQPPDTVITSAPPTLSATARSGVAPTYTSSSPGVCTVTSAGTIAFISVGACSITATQGATGNYAAATPVTRTFAVLKTTLTVAVRSSSATPSLGASVTFTAAVTGGFSPTGTVGFLDGSTVLATVMLSGGQATYSTTALAVGAHSISVAYSGDGNNLPASSSLLTVTVSKGGTTTALTASSSSSLFASPITLTATVSGHSPTGAVTFKDGSAVLGSVAINSSFKATLTVSTLSVGAHSIVAIYNGDGNNLASSSSPLAISITRPNPATDPDVQGLVTAQATAATHFAQAQSDNVVRRLESLHEDDTPFFSNGIAFDNLSNPAPNALGDTQDPLARDPAFVAIDKASHDGAPAPSMALPPFAIWTAGAVMYGSTDVLGAPQSPNNHFTTSGVTAGVDGRLMNDLKAGFAVGFGADRTSVGADGTTSRATNVSGAAYASYHAYGSLFVDGLIGYGEASFQSNRFVSLPGLFEAGSRSGSEFYGAMIFTSEQKWDSWRFAPYARAEFIDATLDPYTEQGDPTWALSYARAAMHELSSVAGFRVAYDFDMGWGTLSPTLRAEYSHAFDSDMTQVLSYADTPGVNYSFALAALGENTASGALGLIARSKSGLSAEIEYQYWSAGAAQQAQGLRCSLNIPF